VKTYASGVEQLADALRAVVDRYQWLRAFSAQSVRTPESEEQKRRFESRKSHYWQIVERLRLDESLVTDAWREFNAMLAQSLKPGPRWDFLWNPIIRKTMVFSRLGKAIPYYIAYVESTHVADPRELLNEDSIGCPLIVDGQYHCSGNSARIAYILSRFCAGVGQAPHEIESVVEWGGGFGAMARLVRRLNPAATYTIIDTPLLIALQWLYLSSIFTPDAVSIMSIDAATAERGKFNLVSASDLDDADLRGDLFISTWGLNESSHRAQQLVHDAAYFGARHFIVGYTKRTEIIGMRETINRRYGIVEDMPYVDGAVLAFA
jgi:hypothetical protein